jgi:hypothetical protein
MMNEAHDGWKRCIRTRQIGRRILPVANRAGVQHLAMEALFPAFAEQCNITRSVPHQDEGYLSQPEMKDFIQSALDLGWTLIAYEADQFKWLSARHGIDFTNPDNPNERYQRYQELQYEFATLEFTNWREEQQALNLIAALQALPVGARMLVWCGNSHHSKTASPDWIPMGYHFQQNNHINPFVIDQIRTVKFDSWDDQFETELTMQFSDELTKHGGTAGFLIEEVPAALSHYQDLGVDAFLFSTQNELE